MLDLVMLSGMSDVSIDHLAVGLRNYILQFTYINGEAVEKP